jgi:arylformamidase
MKAAGVHARGRSKSNFAPIRLRGEDSPIAQGLEIRRDAMNILAEVQRRGLVSGLFGGMAALALANVARAQTPDPIPCQLGPAPHEKGPLVWMDMDQIELDAAYDQRFYAPMGDQIQKRVASISNAVRARLGEPLRLSYGPSELEKLDIYRARKPNAPIFLFIHGGSWRGGSARNNAYPAEMFVNAGANFIAIDFIDIKQADGDVRLMAAQVRSAIAWVYKNAGSFDADANRLYIGGRSSGAHLTAVALITDWERDHGVPADIVKGGICSSGMYDLKAVRVSKRSSFIRFTDEMEEAMSPKRHLDQLRAPIVVTYGTNETPEFQRQARDFVAAVKAAGKSVELIEAPNYNHYEMGESFGNPYGPSGRATLALMKLPILG